jgi:hypothetical protein
MCVYVWLWLVRVCLAVELLVFLSLCQMNGDLTHARTHTHLPPPISLIQCTHTKPTHTPNTHNRSSARRSSPSRGRSTAASTASKPPPPPLFFESSKTILGVGGWVCVSRVAPALPLPCSVFDGWGRKDGWRERYIRALACVSNCASPLSPQVQSKDSGAWIGGGRKGAGN